MCEPRSRSVQVQEIEATPAWRGNEGRINVDSVYRFLSAKVFATEALSAHPIQLAAVPAKGGDMKTGIIGAGNIGGAQTRRFTATGHQVFLANSRGPQTLIKLAAETGAKPVNAKEAAH